MPRPLSQTDAPLLTNARFRASFRNAGCDTSVILVSEQIMRQ
jgi:hypothetical protein